MLKQIEGSQAVAEAVALCRPEVISAYPITPQTHIVEDLGMMVKSGEIEHCEFLLVESEFGALSACIGSSAAGARSYTATSSQGMLFMMEAVYNASGLGLPIVQAILAKHGGDFIFKSKLREGTEVIAILPAKRVLESVPAEKVETPKQRQRSFA